MVNLKSLEDDFETLQDQLIFKPEEIKGYVKNWTHGLHQYSLRNFMIAALQLHGMPTILAGYRKWNELGRGVLKGNKALKILTPRTYKKNKGTKDEEEGLYFKAGNVWDISQTGFLLSEVPIKEHSTSLPDGSRIGYLWNDMNKLEYINLGGGQNTANHGQLTLNEVMNNSPIPITISKSGLADGLTNGKSIQVTQRNNSSGMIASIFHEIAHIKLNHFKQDLPREVEELEAESVSFIVSTYFGINNPDSAKYIQHWGGDKKLLKGRGSSIIAAAEKIIKIFDIQEIKSEHIKVEQSGMVI